MYHMAGVDKSSEIGGSARTAVEVHQTVEKAAIKTGSKIASS